MSLEHLQGQWLCQLQGQPIPAPDPSSREEILPNIQPGTLLAQLEAISTLTFQCIQQRKQQKNSTESPAVRQLTEMWMQKVQYIFSSNSFYTNDTHFMRGKTTKDLMVSIKKPRVWMVRWLSHRPLPIIGSIIALSSSCGKRLADE